MTTIPTSGATTALMPGTRPPAVHGAAGGRPTPRVIGLDLSIAATGYADRVAGYPATRTIATDPKDYGKDAPGTWRRLTNIAMTIASLIGTGPQPTLIAIEGPSYGSKGALAWDRAGLWWLIYDALTRTGLPVVVITPATLKKYATGKGNAGKTAMAVALQKRAGIDLGDDDNQVDAWWLVAAALDHLGHQIVDLPKVQREALNKVTWPEVAA